MKPLSWKPVHRGLIYCSPACGAQCSWAAYVRARDAANALCRRLGPGWKPRVWENLGWHWEAINGPLRVDLSVNYCCMLKNHYTFFGKPQYAKTPELAIVKTANNVRRVVNNLVVIRDGALLVASRLSLKRSK